MSGRKRWADALDVGELVARLVETGTAAREHYGPRESAFHAAWYARTRCRLDREIPHLCARTRVGIFAALSPSSEIERNHALAAQMADTGDCRHPYGLCIKRARSILTGTDPMETLGGPKVRAFYANLLDPWASGPVTIDRHQSYLLGWHNRELERAGAYALAEQAHQLAAHVLDLRPHEFQALTWQFRREVLKTDRKGWGHVPTSPTDTRGLATSNT